MKEFKTYKELRKASRKYWKRNAKKSVCKIDGKKCISYWTANIWCYYITKHIDNYHRKGFQYDIEDDMLDSFIEKTNNLIGKNVKVGNTIGLLYGIAFTNNGAYYAIQTPDSLSLIGLIPATEV